MNFETLNRGNQLVKEINNLDRIITPYETINFSDVELKVFAKTSSKQPYITHVGTLKTFDTDIQGSIEILLQKEFDKFRTNCLEILKIERQCLQIEFDNLK